MILVDTSVWIDHFRAAENALSKALQDNRVLAHPFVIGELALGNLAQRELILSLLNELPKASVAKDEEVLGFTSRHKLAGMGLGYIDVHLLAAVRLTPGSSLWSRDKRLASVAAQMKLAAQNLPAS